MLQGTTSSICHQLKIGELLMMITLKFLLPKLLLMIILRSNHGKIPRPWYLGIITPDILIFMSGISAQTIMGNLGLRLLAVMKAKPRPVGTSKYSVFNETTGKTGS